MNNVSFLNNTITLYNNGLCNLVVLKYDWMEAENLKLKKLNIELGIINAGLKKDAVHQKEYIKYLEEIMIRISHKVRQPIAHILGLSSLLTNKKSVPSQLKIVQLMRQAVKSLDNYTRELSLFIYKKVIAMKKKL